MSCFATGLWITWLRMTLDRAIERKIRLGTNCVKYILPERTGATPARVGAFVAVRSFAHEAFEPLCFLTFIRGA